MDVWGWIVVYAVGLTLLQLLVYRYLLNNGGSVTRRVGTPFGENDRDTSWSSSSGSNPSQSNGPSSRTGEDADGGTVPARSLDAWPRSDQHDRHAASEPARTSAGSRRCRHCGVENESDETFTLCWNCAREL
jgi:ribosomal protein S14